MTTGRRGFSLIELTAILLLMAVAAGAVSLRVRGRTRAARLAEAVGAIRQFDRITRTAARRGRRPLRMVVDPSAGRIDRVDDRGRPVGSAAMQLPPGVRFGAVLCRAAPDVSGRTRVPCSRRGLTPTYALRLETDGADQWVIVAGLTGEVRTSSDETEVRRTLTSAGAWRDAR